MSLNELTVHNLNMITTLDISAYLMLAQMLTLLLIVRDNWLEK